LHLAANLASTAVVERLVTVPGINLDAKSSDDGAPPIYDAAGKGKLDVVKVLAEAGADINNVGGPSGVSPIGRAILDGHTEVVRYLISRGADVKVQDLDGDSLAFLAAQYGNLEVIKMLRKAGADLETAGGPNRVSPLTIAAQKGHLKVVEYLINQQVDVDQEGIDGDTAVYVASSSGSLEKLDILEALRQAGADLSIPSSKEKYTALHAAIITGRTRTALYLIQQGADPSARTASGNTPAFEAAVKGNLEVLQALGLAGGDLESPGGPSSVTPVAAAAAYGFEEVVAFLVNSGVETGARDNTGRTALDWAEEGGHDAIIRILTI
jgi:ankyrin repeat protein